MSHYSNVSNSTKKNLLAHRPWERFLLAVAGRRQTLAAFILVLVAFGVLYGGLMGYQSFYQRRASELMNSGSLEEVVTKYSYSTAAQVARVRLGKRALDEARYEDALKWYGPVAESKRVAPVLRVGAQQNMALAYYKQSQWDQALDLLRKASEDKTNVSPDYTKLLQARVLEAKGDIEPAKIAYKELSEGAKEGSVKNEAKERLSWFDAVKK